MNYKKKRTFHIYFAFSWIVLLYFRCYWYRKELQVPRDALVYKAPVNFVLRNFIAGIIFSLSSLVEIILVRPLQIWLPLKKQEFMDLCSVSNISVFILDGLLHGYYIHGLSPIGKADVNYDELFLLNTFFELITFDSIDSVCIIYNPSYIVLIALLINIS